MPSSTPGSTAGAVYDYDDAAVTAGQTYFYWVEDVAVSGAATLHGPLSVDYVGPTAVILGAVSAGPGPASATLPRAAALLALLLMLAGALGCSDSASKRKRGRAAIEPRIERKAQIRFLIRAFFLICGSLFWRGCFAFATLGGRMRL